MHIIIKTLLIAGLVSLTIQQSHAESFPPNFEVPAPNWGNRPAFVAWGDCVPVAVAPINIPQVNYPADNQAGSIGSPQPIPLPQTIPYPTQHEPLGVLPPPSPFFNTAPLIQPNTPESQVQISCESDEKLELLQQQYDLASSVSKQKIAELTQAVADTKKQIETFKAAKAEADTNAAKEKLESESLHDKLKELKQANFSLLTRLSKAESNSGSQTHMVASLKQKNEELTALKNAHKKRNDEVGALKKQLEELDNKYKHQQAMVSQLEEEKNNHAHKLTALKQSDIKLTDLKNNYEVLNNQNIWLKESLTKFDDENKTLKSQLGQAQTESANTLRKLNVLSQSAAALTTLQSSYKAKNNENALLKQKLAEIDKEKSTIQSLFDSKQTDINLQEAQNKEIIEGLKKELEVAKDNNISLKNQLNLANNKSSEQTRKITTLTQSAKELVALQGVYKEVNNENIVLKKRLSSLDDSHKTLQAKLTTATTNISSQTRKLTAIGQSVAELNALKSAYKDKNDENSALKLEIDALSSAQESANACKVSLENVQEKLDKSEEERKSLSGKIATLESTTSNQARKITALMLTTSELDALKNAYKDLSSREDELSSKLQAATADADKDGIIDSKDQCPASPAGEEVNIKGCPNIADTDKDGVADTNDLCPSSEAGSTVNSFGCTPTENITLKGVNFATGSATLTKSSLPIIEAAATTIKQNPNLKIEVAGYTDNQGLSYVNKRLSKRRANSVMIELIKQGVDANTLTANGYGEKEPVADNTTENGRANNRRVELKIID